MAKTITKPKSKKKIIINKVENKDGSVVIGWENTEACASSVNSSIHRDLLQGNLIFALRTSPTMKSDLVQLVIVKNIPYDEQDERRLKSYAVGIITKGWTGYYPYVGWNFLEDTSEDLKNWSISEELIEIYKNTIEKFKV